VRVGNGLLGASPRCSWLQRSHMLPALRFSGETKRFTQEAVEVRVLTKTNPKQTTSPKQARQRIAQINRWLQTAA
jgi:hypothetical protein